VPTAQLISPSAGEPQKDSWPPCPRCGSKEFVHRAGFRYLKQYPPMQKYECAKCGKGKKFFSPSEVKHRPGKVRKLATVPILARVDEIRALAEQFPQGEVARRVGTSRSYLSRLYQRYSITLKSFPKPPKPEPEPSLTVTIKIENKMKEMAAIRGCSIALYLQQLAEADFAAARSNTFKSTSILNPIVEQSKRFLKVPAVKPVRGKVDGVMAQRILFVYREGELSISAIAERFGLAESTINRVLSEYKHSELRSKVPQRATNHRHPDSILFGAEAKTREQASP
jgi:transposase-like protein